MTSQGGPNLMRSNGARRRPFTRRFTIAKKSNYWIIHDGSASRRCAGGKGVDAEVCCRKSKQKKQAKQHEPGQLGVSLWVEGVDGGE